MRDYYLLVSWWMVRYFLAGSSKNLIGRNCVRCPRGCCSDWLRPHELHQVPPNSQSHTDRDRTQHGWSGGKRGNFWRNFSGDFHLPVKSDPAQPLLVSTVQNIPRRQAARFRRSGATAAQTEKEGFYPPRVEALRWTAGPQDPHGCQRESLRRDPGKEVLRTRYVSVTLANSQGGGTTCSNVHLL